MAAELLPLAFDVLNCILVAVMAYMAVLQIIEAM